MFLGVVLGFETFLVPTITMYTRAEVTLTFGLGVSFETNEMMIKPKKLHIQPVERSWSSERQHMRK